MRSLSLIPSARSCSAWWWALLGSLGCTIFAREESQEGAAKGCNPRRPGRKSHHPLLAVLAEAPFVLHAWLRSGNTSSGCGVCAFLKEAFAQLPAGWRLRCLRSEQFHAQAAGVVVRELEREDKGVVGRRLIDVPGYTFRVWVTNRTEDAATLWRDYNGRATIEQRIEELKNDMHADGFCTARFFATEAAMLSAIFAYNLLAVYQAQVPARSGLVKHQAMIHKASKPLEPIAPLLPRAGAPAVDWDLVTPGGCAI